MVDIVDRALFDASSWLARLTGDWRYLRTPVRQIAPFFMRLKSIFAKDVCDFFGDFFQKEL